MVEQISKKINSSKELIIGACHQKVQKREWINGKQDFIIYHLNRQFQFYYYHDYSNREIGIIQEFYPTGNFDEDMKYIESKYKSSFEKTNELQP